MDLSFERPLKPVVDTRISMGITYEKIVFTSQLHSVSTVQIAIPQRKKMISLIQPLLRGLLYQRAGINLLQCRGMALLGARTQASESVYGKVLVSRSKAREGLTVIKEARLNNVDDIHL